MPERVHDAWPWHPIEIVQYSKHGISSGGPYLSCFHLCDKTCMWPSLWHYNMWPCSCCIQPTHNSLNLKLFNGAPVSQMNSYCHFCSWIWAQHGPLVYHLSWYLSAFPTQYSLLLLWSGHSVLRLTSGSHSHLWDNWRSRIPVFSRTCWMSILHNLIPIASYYTMSVPPRRKELVASSNGRTGGPWGSIVFLLHHCLPACSLFLTTSHVMFLVCGAIAAFRLMLWQQLQTPRTR